MDCLISIGGKIAEYTVEPVGHQLGYLCFYKRNIDELKGQIIHLGRAKGKLQRRVDDAKRNGEEIEDGVEQLLTDICKIIEDNDKFIQEEEQANTKCCTGAFPIPNLVLRHQLSRRANKKAREVVTGISEVNKFFPDNNVSYCPHVPSSVENKGYEEFESRKQTLMEIMRAVRDPNVRVLGVWGMGGVGKTMLTKEVARIAKDEEKLFSELVFTTISATPNIEKIQEDIRKCLGMDKHDDIGERIKNRLTKENNILVVVDDVWKEIELVDVGISFGKDHKGCKILVTSRSQRVLDNMDVDKDKIFRVGVLLEDEAMNLFSKIAGDKAKEHDLATEIVRECGGLPIAITTVASALKRSSHPVWKNALQELKKSDPVTIDGMDEKVYSSIKLSYNFLRSKEAKKLLLLCSLFEEDEKIPIRLLCDYGIGLNLFHSINKLDEAINNTFTLVKILEDHSLLLLDRDNEDGGDSVYLHDVIRDVVISIASKDDDEPMYNIRDAVELGEYLVKEKFKKSTAISLNHIEADRYPETLKSPVLKLLRLIHGYWNEGKKEFQHHFFEGLGQLSVVDLKGISLKPSPDSSFRLLQNLQTLRLIDCDLGDITWIGELNNLKILHLSRSSITELPKEIGKLNHLLSLNLEGCRNLQVIHPNVISRLTRLEELNLAYSFTNWEDGEGAVNANLGEVKNLRHLTNLSLTVPDVEILPNNMFSDKLDKFWITIGTDYYLSPWQESSRKLTLKLCPESVLKEHGFEVMLKISEFLHLIGLKSAKSVAYELDSMGFPQLKQLRIEDCLEILCILDSNGNMDNRVAFGKLTYINVWTCNKMKSLFPIYNIPKQLQSISVGDCKMVEEIISDGREGDGDLLKISKLNSLWLYNLPKLVQFKARRKSNEIRDGAQSIDDSVVPLFSGEVLFPKLEDLTLERLNVGKIWNGDQLGLSEFGFQSIRELTVTNCDELKGLIPSSVARSLVHLESLYVKRCKEMEEVVFIEESIQEAKMFENISFPKLKTLELEDLPNLKRFYAGDCVDNSSLLKLGIENCPTENENIEALLEQVDKQPLLIHKVSFPKLEKLELRRLNVGKIWNGDQLRSSEFGLQSLTSLVVMNCDELKGLIPSSVARSLVHLETLHVGWCKAMEEVVFIEESTQEAKMFGNISFPKLQILKLNNLPNLKRFNAWDCVDCSSLLKLGIENCPTENENIVALSEQVDKQPLLIHKVESCSSLTGSLFHQSTVKSLSQLRELFIYGCPNLRQIIANDIKEAHDDLDDIADNIVFSQLETLILVDLSMLEIFYSGDSVLKFPRLQHLVVDDCMGMKTFSHGKIDCSMLDIILGRNKSKYDFKFHYFDYDLGYNVLGNSDKWKHWWEDDINTTIQKLWKDENDSIIKKSYSNK